MRRDNGRPFVRHQAPFPPPSGLDTVRQGAGLGVYGDYVEGLKRGLRAAATAIGRKCRACGRPIEAGRYCPGACEELADTFNNKHTRRRCTAREWRQMILERDGMRCQYCGRTVTWHSSQIDHLLPHHHGGYTMLHNLVTACRDCNQIKWAGVLTQEARMFLQNGICLTDLRPRVRRRLLKLATNQRSKGFVQLLPGYRS